MSDTFFTRARLAPWALAVSAVFVPAQAWALFDDDEARKAIIDLRQKYEASKAATDAAILRLTDEVRDRRSIVELSNQVELLRSELQQLRAQNDLLSRQVGELQRAQKDVQVGVEERLRQVEPVKVVVDGSDFTVTPAERREYEAAMELMRRSDFAGASLAYEGLLRRYPDSGYTPSVLYWLGNAQYANRAYRESMGSHRRLVNSYRDHPRSPEALLAIANSLVELKDARAARKTLEDLVKAYPQTEAAAVGRDRLARLP